MNTALRPGSTASFSQWQQQSRLLDAMQVVFIVGPPKCGTSWLMSSLDQHPRATAHGECGLSFVLLPRLLEAFRAHNAHHQAHSKAFACFTDRDLVMIVRQAYDRILLQYVAEKQAAPDRPLLAVIDKTPSNSQCVDLLADLYPAAKFICCDRDVRDAAVSGWFHFSRVGLAEQKTLHEYAVFFARGLYRPYIVKARAGGQRVGPSRYTELNYADHKENPEREIRRLLRFIGLPHADEDVKACVEGSRFSRQSGGRDPGQEQSDSFYRKGVVGDWRNHFSEEFGEMLIRITKTPLDQPVEAWDPKRIPAAPTVRSEERLKPASAAC